MHPRAKPYGVIILLAVFMGASLTSVAFAYWSATFDACVLGEFTISKHYEDGALVFTLDMPVEIEGSDLILLYFDFTPSDDNASGALQFWYGDWGYWDLSVVDKPSWISVELNGPTIIIKMAINQDGSPLGSESSYRFVLLGEMSSCDFNYPVELVSFDLEDTSGWEEEVLFPQFVIPEVPYGSIMAMTSIVLGFLVYRKIG